MAGIMVASPMWLLVLRGLQFALAIIILGMSASAIHDAYIEEEGLSLAVGLITWFVIAYQVLTEKVAALNGLYNVFAVLALDAFMVVMWLSTFAAVAARRAGFLYTVQVSGCFDKGSVINSKTCSTFGKRGVVLFQKGLDIMSAIAGLGALTWLLFVATFVYILIKYIKLRKGGGGNAYRMDAKPYANPA